MKIWIIFLRFMLFFFRNMKISESFFIYTRFYLEYENLQHFLQRYAFSFRNIVNLHYFLQISVFFSRNPKISKIFFIFLFSFRNMKICIISFRFMPISLEMCRSATFSADLYVFFRIVKI